MSHFWPYIVLYVINVSLISLIHISLPVMDGLLQEMQYASVPSLSKAEVNTGSPIGVKM